jgi:Protein of unknown function (DUF1501)
MSAKSKVLGGSDLKEAVDNTRRAFLLRSSAGLGALAAAELMGARALPAATTAESRPPVEMGTLGTGHFPALAKRVIYMHMLGAYSCVDTFEYKPMLAKMNGQAMPESVLGKKRISAMSAGQSAFTVAGPLAKYSQHGKSGFWVSELMPHTAGVVDDLCFIRSMYSEQVNHDPGSKLLHTGFQLTGRPSMGAWVSYALGSDNSDIPSFVVMNSGVAGGVPQDPAIWGPGFLPSQYQGVEFKSGAEPVLYLENIGGVKNTERRRLLDAIAKLSQTDYKASGDPDLLSRVSQYEMSYRMQRSIPEVADLSDEPKSVLEMYGPDVTTPGTFAHNCLIARRLAEKGVKFTTLYAMGWDHHFGIQGLLPVQCKNVDQASAALVKDLKQRGMLDDTLVVFGGEFGRTPFSQGSLASPGWGRDHHGGNFTWWMAGGGTRAGYTHGETDDFNYSIVKDKVETYDFNATVLRILGIDHMRLTYRYQGRDFRLTDVHGNVVAQLLA